jgi:aryl-alcohol dehydrogenase-like predicted oxidoreductase
MDWGYGKDSSFNYESIRGAFQASQSIFDRVCFYDTAEVYGEGDSERVLGRLIEEYTIAAKSNAALENPRCRIVIASKYMPPRDSSLEYPSALIKSVKASLERVALNYFDLYQIHGPVGSASIETLADSLVVAYREVKSSFPIKTVT